MPSPPLRLEDWNFDSVQELVSKGYFETDVFDFKEVLSATINRDSYRKRIATTACAFANVQGGFLVFGVKDAQSSLTAEERLVGIPKSLELAKWLGDAVSSAQPTIRFVPQNPPIELPDSKTVIFVVHIPPGNRGPHMTSDGKFYKRTNKGNEAMSYLEIESSFLRYEERIAKVKLLYLTLIDMWIRAQSLLGYAGRDDSFSLLTTESGEILSIMSDSYGLLSRAENLPGLLLNVRRTAEVLSTRIQVFHQQSILPMANKKELALAHNQAVAESATELQGLLDESLDVIEREFGFKRDKREEDGRIAYHIDGIN